VDCECKDLIKTRSETQGLLAKNKQNAQSSPFQSPGGPDDEQVQVSVNSSITNSNSILLLVFCFLSYRHLGDTIHANNADFGVTIPT
jgi:hypothetical protein